MDLRKSLSPTSGSKQGQLRGETRLLRVLSGVVLKTSKDGDGTTSWHLAVCQHPQGLSHRAAPCSPSVPSLHPCHGLFLPPGAGLGICPRLILCVSCRPTPPTRPGTPGSKLYPPAYQLGPLVCCHLQHYTVACPGSLLKMLNRTGSGQTPADFTCYLLASRQSTTH